MKKTILSILGSFIVPVSIVVLLLQLSTRSNSHKNGFKRIINDKILKSANLIDIGYSTYYLAGVGKNGIYLGNYGMSGELLMASSNLTDTNYLRLNPPTSIAWAGVKIFVDYPNILLIEGISSSLTRASVLNRNYHTCRSDSLKFEWPVPVSESSFFFRTSSHALGKALIKNDSSFNSSRIVNILNEQEGGIFSTDGMLLYDFAYSRLIYIFYYRNQFICLDSNLNIEFRGQTIDTVSHSKLKVVKLSSTNESSFAAPPIVVNRHAFAYGHSLYVHSKLKADNQPDKIFDESSTIDIYSLTGGKYQYSFYIPDYKGHKIDDFKVYENKIVLIQGHYLVVYILG
jgi:hypothetical protein